MLGLWGLFGLPRQKRTQNQKIIVKNPTDTVLYHVMSTCFKLIWNKMVFVITTACSLSVSVSASTKKSWSFTFRSILQPRNMSLLVWFGKPTKKTGGRFKGICDQDTWSWTIFLQKYFQCFYFPAICCCCLKEKIHTLSLILIFLCFVAVLRV